jgi:hypothetical protein
LSWLRRKSAQVMLAFGDGRDAVLAHSLTVEAATVTPRRASSPWMRRQPRVVLAEQAQDQGADGADGPRSSPSPWRTGNGMMALQEVALPAQEVSGRTSHWSRRSMSNGR